jgi:hypothetical protein
MESFAGADLHKRVTQLAVLREGAAAVAVSFRKRSEDRSRSFEKTAQTHKDSGSLVSHLSCLFDKPPDRVHRMDARWSPEAFEVCRAEGL